MVKFNIVLMDLVDLFLGKLDVKTRDKVLFNLWKSREVNDPKLFKKITNEIWEFRTKYANKQIRLLAFWDKEEKGNTLVIATHGFVKKTQKIPKKEIDKAMSLKEEYFLTRKK